MRTNVVIDDRLIEEAFRLSKHKTKKDLIRAALSEFIQNRKKMNLKKLRGKIEFADNYDYKKMRNS